MLALKLTTCVRVSLFFFHPFQLQMTRNSEKGGRKTCSSTADAASGLVPPPPPLPILEQGHDTSSLVF